MGGTSLDGAGIYCKRSGNVGRIPRFRIRVLFGESWSPEVERHPYLHLTQTEKRAVVELAKDPSRSRHSSCNHSAFNRSPSHLATTEPVPCVSPSVNTTDCD